MKWSDVSTKENRKYTHSILTCFAWGNSKRVKNEVRIDSRRGSGQEEGEWYESTFVSSPSARFLTRHKGQIPWMWKSKARSALNSKTFWELAWHLKWKNPTSDIMWQVAVKMQMSLKYCIKWSSRYVPETELMLVFISESRSSPLCKYSKVGRAAS